MKDLRSRRILEFEKILEQVAEYAYSSSAKQEVMSISPFSERAYIEELLNEVEEADKVLFVHSLSPSFAFDDISSALEKADVMSVLSMGELIRICRVLRVSRNLQTLLLKVNDDTVILLKAIADRIFTDKNLEDDIDRALISDTEMSDNASPELKVIRQKISRIANGIKTKLQGYVTSPTFSKYLQDSIITVRGDRYVIPVRSECKGAIPGLIHDQSASGQTIYVEPMAIVEMNNDLKSAYLDEDREMTRILREFTFRVSKEVDLIRDSFEKITRLDVIFAKAYYANSRQACKPEITETPYVYISQGRHPLIDPAKVVSNTVYVGKDIRMLLITGPNTGGKTVCLKTLGLLTMMALSGLYVPAKSAEIGIFDEIFCDIGDEQSIEQNLSTFSSHISNISSIVEKINDRSLVLLDELGAGTDPTEGAGLALAVSEYLRKSGCASVVTTHYNEMKEYAVVTEGVQNASMEFNPMTYSPTFKLNIGTPGASNALLIAERLGLKQEIVDSARAGIKGQKVEFENVLMQLEQSRRELEINLAESERKTAEANRVLADSEKEREKLFAQRERLNQSVKKETKRLVESAVSEANEIIDTLRSLLDNPTDSDLFKAHKLRKELKKYIIEDDNEFQGMSEELEGDIVVGDYVLVKKLNSEGVVEKINPIKGEATVKLGTISTKMQLKDLQRLKKEKKQDKKPVALTRELRNEGVPTEINIIGKASADVPYELEAFLEQAIMGGASTARVIHGVGEGVLRKAVRAYLAGHSEVKSYRDGVFGEGGKGVTVVTFK